MAGLAGLSGLVGLDVQQPEAAAEDRLGGPADPRHAQGFTGPERYPWQLRQLGTQPQAPVIQDGLPDLAGAGTESMPAGTATIGTPLFDAIPQHSHAAPWPTVDVTADSAVSPDRMAARAAQVAEISAVGLGASAQHEFILDAVQDKWAEIWSTGPETATLQQPPPQQVAVAAAGYGSTDRAGNPRGVNDFDLQNAHFHRRIAQGSVPGNYLWMKPGGRPMIKTVPGPARPPIGAYSPFTNQDLTRAFGVQGAVLQTPASDYTAPPDPYTSPPPSPSAAAQPGPVSYW